MGLFVKHNATGLPTNSRIKGASGSVEQVFAPLEVPGFCATLVEHQGLELAVPAQAEHRLSIALGRRPGVTTNILGCMETQTLNNFAVNTVPSNMDSEVIDPKPGRFLFLRYSSKLASGWENLDPALMEPRPGVNQDDPLLKWLSREMLREIENGPDSASSMMIEGIALQVVAHIVRRYHDPSYDRSIKGGLAPWQVTRVTDYMESEMHLNLRLSDLAALVDLSQFHFARAFHEATGFAPHQYLTKLRLARAAEYLVNSDLSIFEIAKAVGYNGAKSLQRPFKRQYRISPREYRRLGKS